MGPRQSIGRRRQPQTNDDESEDNEEQKARVGPEQRGIAKQKVLKEAAFNEKSNETNKVHHGKLMPCQTKGRIVKQFKFSFQ